MNIKIKDIFNLIKKGQFLKAEQLCEEISGQENTNHEFVNIYGYILFKLEKIDQAIEKWKDVINLNPKYFLAISNLGNAYSKKRDFVKSIEYFEEAIKLNPNYFEAQYGIGNVYSKLSNYNKALFYLNNAIKIKPDYMPALKSKVVLLRLMNKNKDALELSDKLLNINSKDPQLYFEKAETLSSMGRVTESIQSYKDSYILNPDYPYALGSLVYEKLNNCEWDNIELEFDEIKKNLSKGKKVCSPLIATTIFDSAELHYIASKKFVQQIETENNKNLKNKTKKNKLNIGYFSADFRDHAVGHLIARMLECHDKSKFKIFGFYFGTKHKETDRFYKRFKNIFDEFHNIFSMSDEEVKKLSNHLEIDIAVDLMAHTGGEECRLSMFSTRLAQTQINFLGYPGTSGANFIDYILADKLVIPEKNKKFFSEKVIYLPNSYQPSELNRIISNRKLSKKDFNLPENKFIYCCFNSNQKILPSHFNVWMNILKKTPDSILWLLSGNDTSDKNLISEAEKKGVESKRIIFSKKIPIEEHLDRIKLADLFLDTFPYNAHTSCSDCLWAGVPILTKIGESFPSRVAASLLTTSDLSELITNSNEDYENKAIYLAKNKSALLKLKQKIESFKYKNPLFNSELFAKNIEKVYEQI